MASTAPAPMPLEQMLALPDDGMDRELIRGELRETPWAPKDRWHGLSTAQVGSELLGWCEARPRPRGEVACLAGFRLERDPDTAVGIDVAFVGPGTVAATPEESDYYEGPPSLAVEILAPSDTQGEIDDRITLYLEMGVPIVWVLNPRFRTVTVFRPGAEPALFSASQELAAGPHLPGFRVRVAKLFGG